MPTLTLMGLHFISRLLGLPAKYKTWAKVTNALAYYGTELIFVIKMYSAVRVTRLGKILPFGRFFMAKFFLEKIAQ